MKALYQLYASTALLCFGALLISQESIASTITECGSVSMTLTSPTDSTAGAINCTAYGDGNISLKDPDSYNVNPQDSSIYDSDGNAITAGDLPTYDSVLDPNDGTPIVDFDTSTGTFTVDTNIWSVWKSIYVGIKQASGSAGGGWALFELTAIVAGGDYATKLGCSASSTTCNLSGISHDFTVGGERQDTFPPVPVPAAVWLFGSGLLGLMGFSRRSKEAV